MGTLPRPVTTEQAYLAAILEELQQIRRTLDELQPPSGDEIRRAVTLAMALEPKPEPTEQVELKEPETSSVTKKSKRGK